MSISSVFEFNKEYIHSYSVTHNPISKTCTVVYTPWSFDLIDKDIDLDEEGYEKLTGFIDRFLGQLCKDALRRGEYERILITKNKMIFRHEIEIDHSLELYVTTTYTLGQTEKARQQLVKTHTSYEPI